MSLLLLFEGGGPQVAITGGSGRTRQGMLMLLGVGSLLPMLVGFLG